MSTDPYASIFTSAALSGIFPPERSDQFFEALFGDPADGSYDIELTYAGSTYAGSTYAGSTYAGSTYAGSTYAGSTPAESTPAGPEVQRLCFDLRLHQRPGKCLACNLTYGLPQVFSRHPVINLKAVVAGIDQLLGNETNCAAWELGRTRELSRELHVVPLRIELNEL